MIFQQICFRLEINISLTTFGNCRHKIKSFSVQNTKQYSFCEKKCSLNSGKLNHHCVLSAKLKLKLRCNHRSRKISILWRQLQEFFGTAPDLPSILPESAIFGFLDDALEHKFLLKHTLLIFKNYFILISTYLKTTSQKLEILNLM